MENTRVFEKLEKILAKTKPGSNASESEVQAAFEIANKIMTENNLSMLDLDEFSRQNRLGELTHSDQSGVRKWYKWEQSLAASLANFFDCKVILQKSQREKKSRLIFVGREANIRTCLMMFSWLDQDCLTKASCLKKGHSGAWLSFCVGFADEIQEKVYQAVSERKEEFKKTGKELAMVDEVKAYMTKLFNPKVITVSTDCFLDSKYLEGRKEGRKVNLNHQIGAQGLEHKTA